MNGGKSTRSFAAAVASSSSSAGPSPPVNAWKQRPLLNNQPAQVQNNHQNIIEEKKGREMHGRLVFLVSAMYGLTVRVTVQSGSVYEGVLQGISVEPKLGVCLAMARLVSSKDSGVSNAADQGDGRVLAQLVVKPKDLFSISAVDVDLAFADDSFLAEKAAKKASTAFRTDTDISASVNSGVGGTERALEKWSFGEDDAIVDLRKPVSAKSGNAGSLDDVSSRAAKWDQFAANERLFGVKSDYKEDMYTTKLDRDSEEYKRKIRQAERLAAEIEGAATTNVHMAEERGQLIDEKQMDEEDRFGAVVRKPGSYVPPAARKSQPSESPKRVVSPQVEKPPVVAPAETAKAPTASTSTTSSPGKQSSNGGEVKKPSTLDPHASSFKFNLKASEFRPVSAPSPNAQPVQSRTQRHQQQQHSKASHFHRNIFGKNMPLTRTKVKESLFRSFNVQESAKSADLIGTKWENGNGSYVEVVEASSAYPVMPMAYGAYGFQPYQPGQIPFQMIQIPAGQYPPQMYAAPAPQFIQGQPQMMQMQYGYQPVVILPNGAVSQVQHQQQPPPFHPANNNHHNNANGNN